MSTTHLAPAAQIETCHTCGQDFDPEAREHDTHTWVELDATDEDGAGIDAPVCGKCADPYVPPTWYYEVRNGVGGIVDRATGTWTKHHP